MLASSRPFRDTLRKNSRIDLMSSLNRASLVRRRNSAASHQEMQ